jgi:polar amino acid transport system substrate-binding protein
MKMGSRRVALAALLCAVVVVAGSAAGALTTASTPSVVLPTLSKCVKSVKSEVVAKGKLTVATDSPALAPWFSNDNPSNEKGYESAVAYKIATTLGLKTAQVTWYSEPYWESEAAGTKPFDFDINEIVYNKTLSTDVSFSDSYFNVNQSLVSIKGEAIVTKHTPKQLKTYLYGDVKGSVGLAFIRNEIQPKKAPVVYATLALAIDALEQKQIDAIVVDTPTGQYMASQQLTSGVQVGQFHTTSEHYSLVLQKSNKLTACVNTAIATMVKEGALSSFSKKYLSIYNSVPVIKP